MALEKRSDILKEVTKTIDEVSECLQRGGKLIVAVQEFGELVLTAAEKALRVHGEIRNEEIKRIYQVKRALHDLVLVAEKAFVFLDKVDDVVWYCGGDSMAAAREELRFSVNLQLGEGFWGAIWRGYYSLLNMLTRTPDLHLLHDLCEQLSRSLAQAGSSYEVFVDACKTASRSCGHAAELCARKASEARENKRAACVIGGTTSGLALAAGLLLAFATAGIAPAVVGAAVGTVGAVATLRLARDYAESEASFRSIQGEFDCLLRYALDLKEGVTQVHTNLKSVSTQVNTIVFCMKNGQATSVVLIQDALKRLNVACTDSHVATSRCRERVNGKLEELKNTLQMY